MIFQEKNIKEEDMQKENLANIAKSVCYHSTRVCRKEKEWSGGREELRQYFVEKVRRRKALRSKEMVMGFKLGKDVSQKREHVNKVTVAVYC